MSSFLLRFILKQLGLDEILDEVTREMVSGAQINKLLIRRKYSIMDSFSILNEILNSYNINLNIEKSDAVIDERRRLSAIASNSTPLNIKNPEEVLWTIAQTIKPKGGNSRIKK
ncbi:MAG: RNase L inhibitor [Candidatus Rehaiarchaeum fermentans]|nr:RNase L inhibitor [Candidatus Rehaiarchaeum fermentans]